MKILSMVFTMGLSMIGNAQTVDEVWNHHIETWSERNLDALMEDYSERSLMIVNNHVFRGKNEIRKVFEKLFEIFDKGENRIDSPVVEGRIVYITWHFTPNFETYFGTDTFVIEEGKVLVQTIASPLYEIFPVID